MTIKIQRNIALHMALSGLLGGIILGALYGAFMGMYIVLTDTSGYLDGALGLGLIGLAYGGFYGGMAGLPMGMVSGLLMTFIRRNRRLTPRAKRLVCYGIALLVVVVTGLLLTFALGLEMSGLFVGLPGIVAAGASWLAVDRHFAHYPPGERKKKAPSA